MCRVCGTISCICSVSITQHYHGHTVQISGHVTNEEGKKKIALVGKWNSYLDMQKCDEEGTPLPGSELVRLWTVCTQCANSSPVQSHCFGACWPGDGVCCQLVVW